LAHPATLVGRPGHVFMAAETRVGV
jgi:hypothetical protein